MKLHRNDMAMREEQKQILWELVDYEEILL